MGFDSLFWWFVMLFIFLCINWSENFESVVFNRNLMLCCILLDVFEVKFMRGFDFFWKLELFESCVGMNICIDMVKLFLNGFLMYLYEWKV